MATPGQDMPPSDEKPKIEEEKKEEVIAPAVAGNA